jgi:hypothetical protein
MTHNNDRTAATAEELVRHYGLSPEGAAELLSEIEQARAARAAFTVEPKKRHIYG